MNDATRVLAGRYEVGELIGRGGMAEVHIGRDTRLGRTVAIKILRSDLARDPAFQARFRREAQAAAALNHPAIVAVYDTGEDVVVEPSGATAHVPFIVMEYVEGHTVRDILRDGAAVPIDEAVEITTGVLSALAYSHHAGIVHRDIKPANVMLTPAGAVKVMDFGIARAVADSAATMTQTQAVIGTAQYLSPEQARGETVDARSDLYSTGCLLFELLTGRPPFVGDSPVSVAYQHVREDAPVPSALASDVPEALDRIVAKALSKDRETRYQTAAEFRADLEAYAHGGRVNAPAVGAAAVGGAAATQVIGATPSATQVMAPTWAPTSPAGPPTDTLPPVPESSGRRWVWWTLGVVALVALAGIVVALLNQPPDVEMVTVPDVVGHSEEDARAELDEVGLEMRRQEEPSSEQEEGKVTRTDPVADQEVEKGSTVDVWISTGPSEITVPDVAGATQEQARQAIEEAGLVWGQVTTVDSADQDRDRVVSTDPAIGDPISEGDTVNVQLASGNVEVPSVVDQEQEAASQALTDLRMRTRIVEEASDKAPGTVIRQDRQGLLPFNTLITLTVAIESTTTTVPDNLVGMTYEQAVAALQQADLVAARNDVDSAQPAGTVISTSPNRGVSLPKGGTVTLNVSRGPAVQPTPTP